MTKEEDITTTKQWQQEPTAKNTCTQAGTAASKRPLRSNINKCSTSRKVTTDSRTLFQLPKDEAVRAFCPKIPT